MLRVQVDSCLVGWKEFVERGIEDTDDLRTLVVDDRVGLLIPKYGNSVPISHQNVYE